MQETWVQSQGQEDPLRKEKAIHSSILTWEILWTEGPGRLQSMGVVKDLATKQQENNFIKYTSSSFYREVYWG